MYYSLSPPLDLMLQKRIIRAENYNMNCEEGQGKSKSFSNGHVLQHFFSIQAPPHARNSFFYLCFLQSWSREQSLPQLRYVYRSYSCVNVNHVTVNSLLFAVGLGDTSMLSFVKLFWNALFASTNERHFRSQFF